MKARSLLLLAISAVLGVLAIGLVRGLTQPTVLTSGVETRSVVVAATTMKFGDKLTPATLRMAEFLPDSIPEGAFDKIPELTTGQPRVVIETIHDGEIVLASKITGAGGRASLSSIIDPSMRAIAIRVDDVSGAAGFVMPSDRVDVMLTHTDNGQARTDVLLQDIKVLAIDQEAVKEGDKPTVAKAVTLEVTPDQAQMISLARSIGTLSLSLRNLSNVSAVPTRSISAGDLVGVPKKPGPPSTERISIVRGSNTSVLEVTH